MTNLDVSLRLKMVNQLGAGAKAAEKDLKGVKEAAQQIGKGAAAEKLGRDLAQAGGKARIAKKDVVDLGAATARIKADAAARLADGLRKAGTAARDAQGALLKLRLDRFNQDLAAATAKFATMRGEIAATAKAARELDGVGRFRNFVDGVGRRFAGRRPVDQGVGAAAPALPLGKAAPAPPPGIGAGLGHVGTAGAAGAAAGLGMRAIAPLGAGYLGKKAFDQSVSFDAAWAEVVKAVNDADAPKLEKLKKMVLDISLEFGIARSEVAGLTAEAAKAGISYEDLGRFIRLVGKDAISWDMIPREAAQKLAFIKAATGKTIAEMEVLSEKINGLADNSSASERDVVDMFLRVGAAAREAGLKEDDTLAIVTAIRSGGMDPEVTARWFGAFAGGLRTAEEAPPRVEEGLNKLGLTAEKVVKGMKIDARGTILDLFDRLAKSDDAAAAATQIFGREWWDETLRAKGGIAEIKKQFEFLKTPGNYLGSLDKNLAIKLATAKSHLEKMDELVSRIGEGMSRWSLAPLNATIDRAVAGFQDLERRANIFERWSAEREARDAVTASPSPAETAPPSGTWAWLKKTFWGDDKHGDVLYEWLMGDHAGREEQLAAAKRRGTLSGLGQLQADKDAAERELRAAERAHAATSGSSGQTPFGYRSGLATRDAKAAEDRLKKAKDRVKEVGETMSRALASPDVDAAMRAEMERFSSALEAGGQKAIEAGRRIAAELQRILSFTARPTIEMPAAPSAPAPGKQSSLGSPVAPVAHTTIHQHIHGGDSRRVAQLARHEQEREIRRARAGALHDTGAWA